MRSGAVGECSETRKLLRALRHQGFCVAPTRSHWRITHPAMDGFVIVSNSSSDWRAERNLFAMLRRRIRAKAARSREQPIAAVSL
jgi:hypothetical protein